VIVKVDGVGVRRNLAAVHERIARAAAAAGRAESDIQLLAVSKGQPADAMRQAHAGGQRVFGEIYVQELIGKSQELADVPDLSLRFIGRLQRNKVKDLCRVASLAAVDGVDSVALVDDLAKRLRGRARPLEVLIQVNVDAEPQKAGVRLEALDALVDHVAGRPELSLRGLMAIPAARAGDADTRVAFARIRDEATRLGLPVRSIGMSDDLELAIAEGSTMVRVGTAIFGPRVER
jgi:pyridoxal phosphate enzyme (YggS family)